MIQKISYRSFQIFDDEYEENNAQVIWRYGEAFMAVYFPDITDEEVTNETDFEKARNLVLTKYVRWEEMFWFHTGGRSMPKYQFLVEVETIEAVPSREMKCHILLAIRQAGEHLAPGTPLSPKNFGRISIKGIGNTYWLTPDGQTIVDRNTGRTIP